MRVPRPRVILGVGLTIGISACAVGPNFTPPHADAPATYAGAGSDMSVSAAEPDPLWWHAFGDAELDQLEVGVRQGNLDLQAGLLRITAARTQVQVARARGLPTLGAIASYNREQLGAAGILKARESSGGGLTVDPALTQLLTAPINLFQVGFDASWELDLFGKVRRGVEVASAQRDEAVEARRDMLVSLQAEVAQTYMQLRAAQTLQSITRRLVDDEQQILDLTLSRQHHGLAQEADVESSRAEVANLRAQLPQYEQNVAIARHALAVLTGQMPAALDAQLGSSADLPALPRAIPIGVPSTLARRRPDVRQAEAALHAATAQVGVSMASLYPDISLTGTAGVRNTSTRYLFDWASKFYTAGPSLSLPLFQGGALVGNVTIARADAGQAALSYRKIVLSALQDVEDGLVLLTDDGARVVALRDAVAASERSVDIAMHSYKTGLSSYIAVLTVERQLKQAQQQFAQATLAQLTDLIKLYKALGGGWEASPATGAEPESSVG